MLKPDLILKLAFLVVCVVVVVCLTILIACGHDGILVDTFMGISAVMFGANGLQLWNTLRK